MPLYHLPSQQRCAHRRGAGASSRNHCFLDQTPLYLGVQAASFFKLYEYHHGILTSVSWDMLGYTPYNSGDLKLELQHHGPPWRSAEAEQAANGVNLMVSLTQVTQDIPAP